MAGLGLLNRSDAVLSVVDIQEKLAATMPETDTVVENVHRLVLGAQRLGLPMIVTEQYPRGLGPTLPELAEAMGAAYAPIEKLSFSCAGAGQYLDRLAESGRKQVVLCGMEAHVCVLQTCIHLLERGYAVHVAADAVCSRRADHKELALDQMRSAGAVVTCVEAVIFQLLGRAGTPEFKDLLKIVK